MNLACWLGSLYQEVKPLLIILDEDDDDGKTMSTASSSSSAGEGAAVGAAAGVEPMSREDAQAKLEELAAAAIAHAGE